MGNCARVIACHAGELNLRQYAMAARYTRCMPRPARTSLTVALLACSALLVACSSAPTRLATRAPQRSPDSATIIYVIKRSWHAKSEKRPTMEEIVTTLDSLIGEDLESHVSG